MMKIKIIFSLIFLIVTPLVASGALVIELQQEAKVSGLYVELGEIAAIKTEENRKKVALEKIPLFELPQKETVIPAKKIEMLLSQKIKEEFVFVGNQIVIKPFMTKILEYEIIEKIRSAVFKNYPFLRFQNLFILPLESIDAITVPYSSDLDFRVIVPRGFFEREKYGRLEVFVDNQVFITKPVKFRLGGEIKVLIAKKNIDKECVVLPEFFQEITQKAEKPEIYFSETNYLCHFKTAKAIKKGEKLLISHLKAK